MNEVRRTIATPEEMHALGERIAAELGAGDTVVLTGDLGAGKTTLTRGIGQALGVRGTVTSPTFVIARTHPRAPGLPPLVHVDAYRLSHAAELDDLDIDFPGSIVIVEWGRGMVEALADDRLEIDIDRPHGASASHESTSASVAVEEDDGLADDAVEPREVVIRGIGSRWAGVTW